MTENQIEDPERLDELLSEIEAAAAEAQELANVGYAPALDGIEHIASEMRLAKFE